MRKRSRADDVKRYGISKHETIAVNKRTEFGVEANELRLSWSRMLRTTASNRALDA